MPPQGYTEDYYERHRDMIDAISDGYIGMLPKDIKNEIKKYLTRTFEYWGYMRYTKKVVNKLEEWRNVIRSAFKNNIRIKVRINGDYYDLLKYDDSRVLSLNNNTTVYILRSDIKVYENGFTRYSLLNEKFNIQLYFRHKPNVKDNWIERLIKKMIGYKSTLIICHTMQICIMSIMN